jgi:ribosomal protein L37AE/L43A
MTTVTEATEVIPQPSSTNNENHTKPKRTRKEATELALRQGDERLEEWRFMPVMSIDKALERRKAIVQATQQLMQEGVDYGKIPGSGDKPALLQPGADKLCNLFGLVIKYEVTKCEEDWIGANHEGVPFFFYELKGRAYRQIGDAEYLMGEGLGSCNSWESKYKYRRAERSCPQCGKANIRKSRDGGWFCWLKTDGCGANFAAGDPRIEGQEAGRRINPDMADVVNTVLKMAQKRAKVSTTINATSASEFFTQDVEDNPATVAEEPDPHGFTQDTGSNRCGGRESQQHVPNTKLAGSGKPPLPAPRLSARGSDIKAAFAQIRESIGEVRYLEEMQVAGVVRDVFELRRLERIQSLYDRLWAIAQLAERAA